MKELATIGSQDIVPFEVLTLVKSGLTNFNPNVILSQEELSNPNTDKAKLALYATEISKVAMILQFSKDLNVPIASAFQNIYILPTKAGLKPALSYHLIIGLLRKAGIKVEILEDLVPKYKYISRKGLIFDEIPTDPNGVPVPLATLPQGRVPNRYGDYTIFVPNQDNSGFLMVGSSSEFAVAKFAANYTTTVKLTRFFKNIITEQVYEESVTCSYDSFEEEMLLRGKDENKLDTRLNYTKTFFLKNALVRAAHLIADDIILGLPEVSILAKALDVPFTESEVIS